MKPIKSILRGWLAISFIQQLALAVQHLFNPTILYLTFFDLKTSETLAGHLFAFICFEQSILNLALLINESNDKFLHIFHAMNDTVYLLFFIFKAIFGGLVFNSGVIILISSAAVSLILTVIHLIQEFTKNLEDEIPEKRARARKLIASHYLESQISDYSPISVRKNK